MNITGFCAPKCAQPARGPIRPDVGCEGTGPHNHTRIPGNNISPFTILGLRILVLILTVGDRCPHPASPPAPRHLPAPPPPPHSSAVTRERTVSNGHVPPSALFGSSIEAKYKILAFATALFLLIRIMVLMNATFFRCFLPFCTYFNLLKGGFFNNFQILKYDERCGLRVLDLFEGPLSYAGRL